MRTATLLTIALLGLAPQLALAEDVARPVEDIPISLLFSGGGDQRFAIVVDGAAVRYRGPVGTEAPAEVVFELDAEAHADLFATFRRSGVLDYALDTAAEVPAGALLIEAAVNEDGAALIELRIEDAAELALEEPASIASKSHAAAETLADFCDQLAALAAAAHRRQTP